MSHATEPDAEGEERAERYRVLAQLEDWLEGPMLALSFAWLALVVVELAWGGSQLLEVFGTAIWVAFLLEFAVRLVLAPERGRFVASNWLSALALLAPALRLFRRLPDLSPGARRPRSALCARSSGAGQSRQ
jgi:voltage-gated potassium channel